MKEAAKKAEEAAKKAAEEAAAQAAAAAETAKEGGSSAAGAVVEEVSKVASTVADTAGSAAVAVKDTVGDAVGTAGGVASDTASGAAGAVQGAVTGIIEGVQSAVGKVRPFGFLFFGKSLFWQSLYNLCIFLGCEGTTSRFIVCFNYGFPCVALFSSYSPVSLIHFNALPTSNIHNFTGTGRAGHERGRKVGGEHARSIDIITPTL